MELTYIEIKTGLDYLMRFCGCKSTEDMKDALSWYRKCADIAKSKGVDVYYFLKCCLSESVNAVYEKMEKRGEQK